MFKPGQCSKYSIVEDCLNNIIRFCEENKIKSVAIPLLGTGTGGVNQEVVIELYNNKLKPSETYFYVAHYKNNDGVQ